MRQVLTGLRVEVSPHSWCSIFCNKLSVQIFAAIPNHGHGTRDADPKQAEHTPCEDICNSYIVVSECLMMYNGRSGDT